MPAFTSREQRGAWLCFLAILFMAIAWMAVLPPFEGMDEAGHYASIREIASAHRLPMMAESRLPQEVTDYARLAPLPYNSTDINQAGNAQFGGMSYPLFFATSDNSNTYKKMFRAPAARRDYVQSDIDNWEAQHPPLYYLLMTPVMLATDSLPLVSQFLVLRFVSFVLALSGMVIALRASLRINIIYKKYMLSGLLLYPLIVPVYIQEFARLGNDSLCLMLTGVLWAALLRWHDRPHDTKSNLTLGIVFALGLLTKALFLPMLAGFIIMRVHQFWRDRRDNKRCRFHIQALKAFILPVMFAGLWYVQRLKAFGTLAGGLDEAFLAQHGGLWRGLVEHFTVYGFARQIAVTALTWLWGGTASQITFGSIWVVPLLVLNGILVAAAFIGQKNRDMRLQYPLWLYAGLLVGLFYFELACVALKGVDRAPGWYMNIMLPFAGLIYAAGLQTLRRYRVLHGLCTALIIYGGLFALANMWANIALFTGCAVPDADWDYQFLGLNFCFDNVGLIFDRLSVIAWPQLSLTALLAAIVCGTTGAKCLVHEN